MLRVHLLVSPQDYGCTFQSGDVVGAYIDMDIEPHVMTFTVNGTSQGIAYEVESDFLQGQALFPHILTKNIDYKVSRMPEVERCMMYLCCVGHERGILCGMHT